MGRITFVDKNDKVIGYGTKQEAIKNGIIHRIVRVLVFNKNGELLIQKRSPTVKIPNRWDQSAAGHVEEGESYNTAGRRELQEEMGVKAGSIERIMKFYTEEADDNEIKNRFNELFALYDYDGEVTVDNDEVSEYKWVSTEKLSNWMDERPEDFTEGFIKTFKEFKNFNC